MLGAMVQNLVSMVTWYPGFVYPTLYLTIDQSPDEA